MTDTMEWLEGLHEGLERLPTVFWTDRVVKIAEIFPAAMKVIRALDEFNKSLHEDYVNTVLKLGRAYEDFLTAAEALKEGE